MIDLIGPEISRHLLNQSDAKLKPIVTWSFAFSRACGSLRVFTLSSHWFLAIFIFALIGLCDFSGFGFTTLANSDRDIGDCLLQLLL